MYRRDGGGGREAGVTGGRQGQCQGALAEVIHVGFSADKTAAPAPLSLRRDCLCLKVSVSSQAQTVNWRLGGCGGGGGVKISFLHKLVSSRQDRCSELPGAEEKEY